MDGPAGTYYGSGASTVIHGPRYESDLGLRYAQGRGPRDELDLGPRYALGCGPLLPDCGLCNCRTNLSATEPLGVQASGPTPHIGRRCSESPGIGLARYHDARAAHWAQRVLALPGVIATRGRHSACSSRHDREGPPAAHNMPQGGTQYATMQPRLKKVLQCSLFSSFPSTPNRTDHTAQRRTFHPRYSNQTFLQLRQKLDMNGIHKLRIEWEWNKTFTICVDLRLVTICCHN